MTINFYHGDCMDWMRDRPDGYYDLAVVDPPYGDGGGKFANSNGCRFGERFKRYGEFTPPTGLQQVRGLVECLQESGKTGGEENRKIFRCP